MPLCITLGFTENGRTAQPTVLYAGQDRDAAREALENPPVGIIRTSLISNPPLCPNRSWPDNIAQAEPEIQQELIEPEVPTTKGKKS